MILMAASVRSDYGVDMNILANADMYCYDLFWSTLLVNGLLTN